MKRLIVLLLITLPAGAIIMRHDRDAARYRELGAKYPAVGALGDRVACTLIAPRWALGAAHTIEGYFNPANDPYVTFGERRYRIDKIILHPRRVRDAVDSDWDVVLLRLAEPVEGIAPVLLYDKQDEVDQIATLVGRGEAGSALAGATRQRGNVHGARNKVEGGFEHSLIFTFSRPPAGEDLEGVCGAGDSGGPALLEKGGKLYTIGIGAWGTGASDPAHGAYEAVDAFARVSSHREWIVETMAADPPSTIPMYTRFTAAESLPDTPAGIAASALLKAFNGGTVEGIAAFYETFGASRPPDAAQKRAAAWAPLMEQYGGYKIAGYREAGPNALAVFVHATKTGELRAVAVTLDGGKIGRMTMADVDALPK